MKKSTAKFRKSFYLFLNIFLVFFSLSLLTRSLFAQERRLIYDVLRNGNKIGKIILYELIKNQQKFLSFNSEVKTSFIFSFYDHTQETSTFENEVMVHASFCQKQTGSGKTNSLLEAEGNIYRYFEDGHSKLISRFPIYNSTLLLYVKPPVNINQVYSQKFQKFLSVKKIDENKYRLTLPDGKYNDYTYNNGTCNKVNIVRSLFDIEFVLRE